MIYVCIYDAHTHIYTQASKKSVLVCDIQGVGDLYTDPQIHSSDGGGGVRLHQPHVTHAAIMQS